MHVVAMVAAYEAARMQERQRILEELTQREFGAGDQA
jgi:hypothetical protein